MFKTKFSLVNTYVKNKNVTGAKLPDNDAMLLLENLKHSNYVTKDRRIGLDSTETMAALKVNAINSKAKKNKFSTEWEFLTSFYSQKLAKMHATGILLRQKQPDMFKSKISLIPASSQTSHRDSLLKKAKV